MVSKALMTQMKTIEASLNLVTSGASHLALKIPLLAYVT
jgi:hypothetical protein